MFKKLIVCTDGSPYGDVACQYGFLLSRALKAEITGLHVLDVRMIEGPYLADISGALGATGYYGGISQFRNLMEAKGDAVRQNFAELARNVQVKAEFLLETGHPVHAILEHESSADLLILGQRGENEHFGKELIGSVADRVTRWATKPCLVTHGQFSPIKRIIAACDGSPISEKVAVIATSMAQALGASLLVLTVADKLDPVVARSVADTAARTCKLGGVDPTVTVTKGHAEEVILDMIAREKADMIVMGAHTHTRVRQWFVGCTTQRILADSGIQALLVR